MEMEKVVHGAVPSIVSELQWKQCNACSHSTVDHTYTLSVVKQCECVQCACMRKSGISTVAAQHIQWQHHTHRPDSHADRDGVHFGEETKKFLAQAPCACTSARVCGTMASLPSITSMSSVTQKRRRVPAQRVSTSHHHSRHQPRTQQNKKTSVCLRLNIVMHLIYE